MATILVVDDEPGIREFLADALALDDHDVGQFLAEPVRRQRAARTRSQDDNPCIHGFPLSVGGDLMSTVGISERPVTGYKVPIGRDEPSLRQ